MENWEFVNLLLNLVTGTAAVLLAASIQTLAKWVKENASRVAELENGNLNKSYAIYLL
jgi:hypothetical protein